MKGLNEYKAEIFRRSESRIKERRRNRNRVLALCIPLCLILVLIPAAVLPAFTADSSPDVSDSAPLIDSVSMDDGAYNGDTAALGSFESFSFSETISLYRVCMVFIFSTAESFSLSFEESSLFNRSF